MQRLLVDGQGSPKEEVKEQTCQHLVTRWAQGGQQRWKGGLQVIGVYIGQRPKMIFDHSPF